MKLLDSFPLERLAEVQANPENFGLLEQVPLREGRVVGQTVGDEVPIVFIDTETTGLEPATDRIIEFFVEGEPKGDARRRPGVNKATGRAQTFPTGENLDARSDVRTAFKLALRDNPIPDLPWEGPAKVDVIDCHVAAKSNPSWPGKHCDKKPDWDNSGKLVGDALNSLAWEDDRRIVIGAPAKTWWHTSGKWVRIRFYKPVSKPPKPPKPLHGRVPNDEVENRIDLYEHGREYGSIWREDRRWHAVYYVESAELGYRQRVPLFDDSHPSMYWGSIAKAEAAVRKAVGL